MKKYLLIIIALSTDLALRPYGMSNYAYADSKKSAPKTGFDEELKLKAGDEEGNEMKSLKTELLISRNDEKALQQLNKLLKKYHGTPMEASLHFRLAELYMRRAKTARFFEVHRDNTNVVQFSPMAAKSASSRGWVQKAVDTYDQIEHRFTHFRDMDLVLFNNAFARQILGQEKLALQGYRRVVNDYSESPLVADCHLAIGESLFNSKSFQAAFDEFQHIRKFPDSRVYPYGLYKAAWALYNLHRAAEGLGVLEEVVAYSKNNAEEGSNRLDLTRESLDDMVTFFEDVKKPSEAVAYFRSQAGDEKTGDLILKLGHQYQRHGRYGNLEVAYLNLLDVIPMVTERPQVHRDLMDSFEMTKDRSRVIEHLEMLSNLCVTDSKWSKNHTAENHKGCLDHLEEAGKVYTSKWHREYKKVPSVELAHLTGRAYEALFKNGQSISGEDKLRFSYAELLFQEKDFRRASTQYSKVAHLTQESKLRHDSAYGALVSLEKAVGDKWSDQDERIFATLASDYITLNPKGEFVTDVRFKKAFISYEKGRFDEAAPQLKDLAMGFSASDRGKKAAHLYLDILNLQKKYEALRDESQFFAQKLKFDAETKLEFTKIFQQAAFTVVQNLEAQEKFSEAMRGYVAYVDQDPHSALADKALYNAIRCAHSAGEIAQATKITERVLHDYPQTSYRLELARTLVTLYETQAQLGHAADVLVKLSEWEPEKRLAYLLAGADYKALNNEWAGAVLIYNQLAQKSETSSEGRLALERLVAYNEKTNQWEKAHHVLEQLVSLGLQPQASIASYKLAQHAAEDEKNDDKAFRLAKKTVGMHSEKKVSTWALAQARLIQGRILEKEFDAAGVKARPDRLSYVLQVKTDKLDHVQKAYQDVMGFGDRSSAIEALVRLAKCYEKYAKAIGSIEAPADAIEEDKKKFYKELENMSLPIEERNAETLQLALKQAKDLHLRDGTIARVQGELNRLSRRATASQVAVELRAPENILPVVN